VANLVVNMVIVIKTAHIVPISWPTSSYILHRTSMCIYYDSITYSASVRGTCSWRQIYE